MAIRPQIEVIPFLPLRIPVPGLGKNRSAIVSRHCQTAIGDVYVLVHALRRGRGLCTAIEGRNLLTYTGSCHWTQEIFQPGGQGSRQLIPHFEQT